MEKLKLFITHHDHSRAFFITYLGLSIALSVIFNLGFFIILALIHFAMDIAKYKILGQKNAHALLCATKDCLIDFAFIFVGIALALVIHHGLGVGVARAASAARAGRASGALRQTILIRAVRALKIVPKAIIGEHSAGETAETIGILRGKIQPKVEPFSLAKFDWAMIFISIFCVAFIFLSPWIFGIDGTEIIETIKHESIPSFEIAIE